MALGVPLDELRQRRLMIGTPMYEGMCHGAYTAALVELALRLRELGVAFRLSLIVNQSSAERARAMILDEFLRSDSRHLLFVDADVAFRAEDALGMLALQGDADPYDVIAGSYPRKSLDWQAIGLAAKNGINAIDLPRYGGDPAVNLGTARQVDLSRPLEVETVAAGFSMVRRATYERLIAAFPDLAFVPDAREKAGHGLGDTLYAFYRDTIDPVTRTLRSEDFAFCDRVRKAGMKVWLCPWMHADHIGNHRFSGTLADALRLRAVPQPTS